MASVAIVHNHPIHYQHLLFCELAKQGLDFEVLFVAAFSGNRIGSHLPSNSDYSFSIAHSGPYENPQRIKTALSIWRRLNRISPAVVIISGYSDAAAWSAWIWASLNRVKKILWAESNAFDHPRFSWRELPKRVFVRGCDSAHVYGTSNLEYLTQLGMAPDKIHTKRAIVNTQLFLVTDAARTKDAEPIRLLYCGRLSPEKNLPFLLRAFARLEQTPEAPRLTLKLVGSGPQEGTLRRLAEELSISTMVDFAGAKQQADLPPIYSESDVLILPSVSEPWGLVVNEAMLSGLPVAVSDRCGCAVDLVKLGNGWIFSPNDRDKLTQLLEQIATSPRDLLRKMGQEGRSLAIEYSPEHCATAVIEIVNELLHSPAERAMSV